MSRSEAYVALLLILMAPVLLTPVAVAQPLGTYISIEIVNPYQFPIRLSTMEGHVITVPPHGVVSTNLPIYITLCLESPASYYLTSDTRFVFQGFVKGGFITKGTCVTVESSGRVEPLYRQEVLIRVVSDPLGVVEQSIWSPLGSLTTITVPEIVKWEEQVLYRFVGFSEPASTSTRVEVPADSPKVVRVVYEELVKVVYPGGEDFFPLGYNLTIRLEDLIIYDGGERLVPEGLLYNGSLIPPIPNINVFQVTITEEGVIEPVYRKEYLVVVEGPQGVIRSWVTEGDIFTIEFPEEISLGDGRKLVYSHVMVNGKIFQARELKITVSKPLTIKPVYQEYYQVNVISIVGSSSVWVRPGEEYQLTVPLTIEGFLSNYVLQGIVINGNIVKVSTVPITIPVNEPLTIQPIYARDPNLIILGLLALPLTVLSVAAALYVWREIT